MKSNFTLTPATAHLFIYRLNRLLSFTGMVEEQSFYTGRKKRATLLQGLGIKRDIENIVETSICYLDVETIQYDSYPANGYFYGDKRGNIIGRDGIIIRLNSDSSIVLYWGQKMKMTPNQIVLVGDMTTHLRQKRNSYLNFLPGARTIFRIGHNVAKGRSENAYNEMYARDYYRELEMEWNKEDFGATYDEADLTW